MAAVSRNSCIGKDNGIPWHIPEDLVRMRELTLGKVLIMGRNTWESIPEYRRPLPKRTNVVITRQENYSVPEGVEVYSTIQDAIEAHAGEEIVSFGGTRVFHDMMPMADTLEITHVHKNVDACTAFFPEVNKKEWKEICREDHDGFSFVTYKRI